MVLKCSFFYLDTAQKLFETLKKRYSKKRMSYKNSSRSGAGLNEVKAAKKGLEDYAFLAWLEPFTRPHRGKTNVPEDTEEFKSMQSPLQHGQSLSDLSDFPDSDNDSIATSAMEDSPVVTKPLPKNLKREMPGKKEKASGKKISTQKSVEIDAMKAMTNFMNRKLEQNEDKENKECEDVFGKLVAVELKKFPENIKYRLKHEINNLIFNYKLGQDASNYPPRNM